MLARLRAMRADKLRPPPQVYTRFDNMTVLITGANSGLGLASAIKYATLGASRLILGVRTKAKGEAAAKMIHTESGRGEGKGLQIDVVLIDMAKTESIEGFVRDIDTLNVRVDVAVLNAGIHNVKWEMLDGFESDIAVNSTGTALLAALMLPSMERSAAQFKGDRLSRVPEGFRPHLTIVSSSNHKTVKSDIVPQTEILRSLSNQKRYVALLQYGISKLLVIAAVQQLAALAINDEKGQPHVIVNSVCPGAVKSDLGRGYQSFPGSAYLLNKLMDYTTKTGEEGARCVVMATTAGLESHGLFWFKDRIDERSPLLVGERGEKFQAQVWKEMCDIWDQKSLRIPVRDRRS